MIPEAAFPCKVNRLMAPQSGYIRMPVFNPSCCTYAVGGVQMALKAADLGHLTSSVDVHKQWVARLEEVRSWVRSHP